MVFHGLQNSDVSLEGLRLVFFALEAPPENIRLDRKITLNCLARGLRRTPTLMTT